jgi:hypothetical protein
MRLKLLILSLLPTFAIADPREELAAATRAEAPPEHHEAIDFLIAHMPESDVKKLKPEYLRENVGQGGANADFPERRGSLRDSG